MHSLSYLDLAFIASVAGGLTRDTMESYTNGDLLDGLNGGIKWLGPYENGSNFSGVQAFDTMEDYADTSPLDGLELGSGWFPLAYNDNDNFRGQLADDNMESYSDGASLNGLNGGTTRGDINSWVAYVDR